MLVEAMLNFRCLMRVELAVRRYGLPDQVGLAVVFIIDGMPFLCRYQEKPKALRGLGLWLESTIKMIYVRSGR